MKKPLELVKRLAYTAVSSYLPANAAGISTFLQEAVAAVS